MVAEKYLERGIKVLPRTEGRLFAYAKQKNITCSDYRNIFGRKGAKGEGVKICSPLTAGN